MGTLNANVAAWQNCHATQANYSETQLIQTPRDMSWCLYYLGVCTKWAGRENYAEWFIDVLAKTTVAKKCYSNIILLTAISIYSQQ